MANLTRNFVTLLKNRGLGWQQMQLFKRDISESSAFPKFDMEGEEIENLFNASTSPRRNIPYSEQLEMKEKAAAHRLDRITSILKNNMRGGIPPMYQKQLELYDGMPCYILPTRPSPNIDRYRNATALVCGVGPDGRSPAVGVSVHADQSMEPQERPIVGGDSITDPQISSEIAKVFENYLKRTDLPSLGYRISASGHWRALKIRIGVDGQLMVQGIFYPGESPVEANVQKAKDELLELFVHGDGKHFDVQSLNFKCAAYRSTNETLHGDPSVTYEISGRRFRVSPDAFVEPNVAAAEVMYDTVAEMAKLSDETILLDICSGIGTIGITLADRVKEVTSVEIDESIVEDAKYNAELNGVKNIKFICNSFEREIADITKNIPILQDKVAILNPNARGVNRSGIRKIRKCETLRKVVYISSHPPQATNLVELCAAPNDKKLVGDPFVITEAAIVDSAPHTATYHWCLMLQR